MTPHDRWLEPDEDEDPEDGLTDPKRAQVEFENAEPNEYPE